LIVTSSGEADEELPPWPTFKTTSGAADPLEALVLDVFDAPPRLMTTSGTPDAPDEELPPWPTFKTTSGAADPLEALVPDVLDAPPRLMTTSGLPDPPDEELPPRPTFTTTSGALDPLEALVPDVPPRLMTISAPPELELYAEMAD
jgi:hypothetical protein